MSAAQDWLDRALAARERKRQAGAACDAAQKAYYDAMDAESSAIDEVFAARAEIRSWADAEVASWSPPTSTQAL